jgi:hypothetical protein
VGGAWSTRYTMGQVITRCAGVAESSFVSFKFLGDHCVNAVQKSNDCQKRFLHRARICNDVHIANSFNNTFNRM